MALYDIEAEKCLLGAILVKPGTIHEVAGAINAADFFREAHRLLYETMLAMAEGKTPLDIVSLADALRRSGSLEKVGGLITVTELGRMVPTAANIGEYIAIVADYSRRRKLAEFGQLATQKAQDMTEPLDPMRLMAELTGIAAGKNDDALRPMRENCLDFLGWLNERSAAEWNGILPGIGPLDVLTKGFQRGDMAVIAARPSMGKTALAVNIALNAAKRGETVAFYSLEMTRNQLIARMVAMLSGINSERIMNPHGLGAGEWDEVMAKAGEIAKLPLYITDKRALSPLEISASARRLKATHGLDLIVIDYLQLMQGGRKREENRVQEIGYISASLKALAGDVDAATIVLSQLSRAVESRGRSDKRPQLSDLRDSGNIEQDADMVMMLYRDSYYHEGGDDWTEIDLKKNRNGATGMVKLGFNKELTKFEPMGQWEPVNEKDIPL